MSALKSTDYRSKVKLKKYENTTLFFIFNIMVAMMNIKHKFLVGFQMLVTTLALLMAAPVAMAAPTTPTADFTDNGDGTVTHRITGLTWMRCAMGQTWNGTACTGTGTKYTWDQARVLTTNFAGKNDWRLPGIAELNSIVEGEAFNPAINSTIFPNTPVDSFWSASVDANNSSQAWDIFFNWGESSSDSKSGTFPVRLVRAGQPFDPLAATTPTADFVDNGDGTVTHLKTGLMWKRCAEGQTWSGQTCSGTATSYPWDTAVALTSSSAGYNNWRLPTAHELLTIVEYRAHDPAINGALFPNTPASSFWSATEDTSIVDTVLNVDFSNGVTYGSSKGSSLPVRLVRTEQFFGSLGFSAQTGVTPNTAITSNTLKVAGIGGATPIMITGGSYSINGGAYTQAAGTVNPGDSVTVRVTASSNLATTTRATLIIGAVSGDFSVTTGVLISPLIATVDGYNRVNLSWGAASGNVGVVAYQVYRNSGLIATLGNATYYADIGLNSATTYTYRISVCVAANNCSVQSDAASVTTPTANIVMPTTPTADFTDNGDGTVTHTITGLTWMRCAMGQTWTGTTCTGTASTYTWDQAKAITANFAGKGDWRLPGIAELNSIIERNDFTLAINTTMFPNTPADSFWSASVHAGNSGIAWNVLFSGGDTYNGSKSDAMLVRLVRTGLSFDPLAATTPTADFVDNGDGTVTHLKTRLMWKRCAEGQTWNGQTCSGTAASYDGNMIQALPSSSAGYNDWRLPTENELLTIVEYRAYDPAINTTIFPNAPANWFWSASTVSGGTGWYVNFKDGFASFYPFVSVSPFSGVIQVAALRVRLVRAPQALPSTVVEFYNVDLDNYFITADAGEAAAIEQGSAGPGWVRTGNVFPSAGSTPVCRFYGSMSPGPNSHFYTVDPAECQGLKNNQIPAGDPRKLTVKSWNFESLDILSTPPSKGACPAGTVPVYRAYNNGFTRGVDSNHRITINQAAIAEVVARGWNNEGIVMCATGSLPATWPPTCTLTASPATVTTGASSTLKVSCTPAVTSFIWGGACAGKKTDTCVVTPYSTTFYTVAAGNAAGYGTAGVSVTVRP